MTESIPPEAVHAARAYEDLHVPALFREWAPRVLDAAGVAPGAEVLDVACGTGVLAREAVRRVGRKGTVTGLDLSAAMLAVADGITPDATWRQGDATALPFADSAFDAVVSQFGLMFFPDRSRALREMARVLRPDGRLVVAVWDALETSPAYPIEVDLLLRLAGEAAADALRAPFVLGDTEELAKLFESCGLRQVEVISVMGKARFPSVRAMVEADLRGWLPVMGVYLDEDTIGRILVEADDALGHFLDPNGELVFDSPAHIVTASVPRRK